MQDITGDNITFKKKTKKSIHSRNSGIDYIDLKKNILRF